MNDLEAQAGNLFRQFADAWDRHDVKLMSACWAETGSAVDPWGRFASGRHGVAELLRGEHADVMRSSTYRLEEIRVRALSETAAVVECDAVIVGARAPNGHPYDLAHTVNAVMALEDDRWQFISLHPSFASARG